MVALLLNYRDAKRSIRCIDSILSQAVDHVVVWDNSADGGGSAQEIRSAYALDSRVIIHVSAENLGFAAGANRGLEACKRLDTDAWVLLINNDARLLPGGLSKLADALTANAGSRLAFPSINHAGRVSGWSYYHRWTGLLSVKPGKGYFPYATGCCLLIACDRVETPLFDEEFFMYGEDTELAWRWRNQAGAMAHVRETLVEHDGTASSGIGSPFYEAHMVAAHLILVRKLASNRMEASLLYASRVGTLLLRASIRSARFHSTVPWRALWHGMRIASST